MTSKKVLYYIATTLRNILRLNPSCRTQIICSKQFHGSIEGGWTINPQGLNRNSVIYSFGVGDDISFDLSLIEKYKVIIHAFDPTPKSLGWVKEQKIPRNLKIHPWGLAAFDGKSVFLLPQKAGFVSFRMGNQIPQSEGVSLPVFRLRTLMKRLGHTKIDILKMDIEGAEYAVIEDILKSKICIGQILVEFHHRFKEFNKKDTEKVVDLLNRKGYKIFHINYGVDYSLTKVEDLL